MLADRYKGLMYEFMAEVLREIGPRESCGPAERQLGERLAALWCDLGHEVRTERFACHPQAFLGCIPISALLYLAATVFYWYFPPLCVVFAAAAALVIFFEVLRYREFIDRFFPRAHGENVVAVVRPHNEVKRRVVVSAHQDSAYEFNLFYFLGNAAVPVLVISLAAVLVPLVGGAAKCLAGGASPVFDTIGRVCMALYPIVGLNLFFHTRSVVPGAMDDLAGIAVLVGLARALAERRRGDDTGLANTEVVLLATSAEEAGLRGAKRFAARHRREFGMIPTYGLFIDGVYDERFLTVARRELTTGARHDPRLVALARQVATRYGWPIRERIIPFGATDAAAFSLARVPSVTLLCQDITRLVPNYHTRNDVLDRVRPESLAVTLQMVIDMIEQIDAGKEGAW
jgi:hypothetical protein